MSIRLPEDTRITVVLSSNCYDQQIEENVSNLDTPSTGYQFVFGGLLLRY